MMKQVVLAPAKLNLTLDVLGKRPDGYHDLRMVMQSVELADRIELETGTGRGLEVRTDLSFLPNNEKNLAAAAALKLQERSGKRADGLSIAIEKRVPVCAGMGGGSSDAAAVLRALNEGLGVGLSRMEPLLQCQTFLQKGRDGLFEQQVIPFFQGGKCQPHMVAVDRKSVV